MIYIYNHELTAHLNKLCTYIETSYWNCITYSYYIITIIIYIENRLFFIHHVALTLQFVMHTFQEDHDPTIGKGTTRD